jgi:hypothetical protein
MAVQLIIMMEHAILAQDYWFCQLETLPVSKLLLAAAHTMLLEHATPVQVF